MKQIKDIDQMPREVALEVLCCNRISNRMRKNCLHALSLFWESETPPKPRAIKIANRLGRATWAQVNKWLSRSQKKRRGLQAAYQKLVVIEPKTPVIEARLKLLDVMAAAMDQFIEGCEAEVSNRTDLCKS